MRASALLICDQILCRRSDGLCMAGHKQRCGRSVASATIEPMSSAMTSCDPGNKIVLIFPVEELNKKINFVSIEF